MATCGAADEAHYYATRAKIITLRLRAFSGLVSAAR